VTHLHTLTTSRLQLEPLSHQHAKQLYELSQDPKLYTWIAKDPPTSQENFRERVRFLEGGFSPDKSEYWLNWIVRDSQSKQLIGQIEVTLPRETPHALLAYTIFRPFWRQGYATEACRCIIEHLFTIWNAMKIIIKMDTRNTASVALAETLGAKGVALIPKTEFFKGSWSGEYTYEIEKVDFLQTKLTAKKER